MSSCSMIDPQATFDDDESDDESLFVFLSLNPI